MRTWAIANQKGGVGKTTTSLAIAAELAARGSRVLLVDLDPHASLTCAFGVPADPQPRGVLELFDDTPPALATLVRASEIANLSYLPAQTGLAMLERRSASQPGLGLALQGALSRESGNYDHVVLDCPPTLGLLMVNALAAADHLIIPTQTEPLALHGLNGMCRTAEMIERSRRRPLLISVLPTLFDRRTRVGSETLAQIQAQHGARAWSEAIPNDTRMCSVDELTRPMSARLHGGRALHAYRKALDWVLHTEQLAQVQAA